MKSSYAMNKVGVHVRNEVAFEMHVRNEVAFAKNKVGIYKE